MITRRNNRRRARLSPHGKRVKAKKRRHGGRPTRQRALQLSERIVAAATELFLARGYGLTSIEAIAGKAGVSKPTLYRRFPEKLNLFGLVIHRLAERWKSGVAEQSAAVGSPRQILEATARRLLTIALSPDAVALYRIIAAEASRFPELARLFHREATMREGNPIVEMLRRQSEAGVLRIEDPVFAAEQFVHMIIGESRRRLLLALPAPNARQIDERVRKSVDLFLYGYSSTRD